MLLSRRAGSSALQSSAHNHHHSTHIHTLALVFVSYVLRFNSSVVIIFVTHHMLPTGLLNSTGAQGLTNLPATRLRTHAFGNLGLLQSACTNSELGKHFIVCLSVAHCDW